MATVTREQVMARISGLGVPLQNVFLIGEGTAPLGGIVVWYPEIGLREILIEKDDLAIAVYNWLCEAGVRRFESWEDLGEAKVREKWEGWDTCADWRRLQQRTEELADKGKIS